MGRYLTLLRKIITFYTYNDIFKYNVIVKYK